MRTKMVAAVIVAAVGGSVGAVVSRPQPGQNTSRSSISFQQGVLIMRLVGSAEHDVFVSRGRSQDRLTLEQNGWGTLPETVDMIHRQSSPESLSALPAITIKDTISASVLDYSLRIIRSEDKKHYAATLTPVARCGPAFSLDDRGVIYTGKPLGC
ncbi:MAG: hypothetical protein ACRD1V_21375 [Vicinamibacterales bacterium]